MPDKTAPPDDALSDAPAAPSSAPPPPPPPKRGPGHRGAEVKDTVAEMAAKAHEISLEAGSRMAAAMKDVVNAAAGISGFVLESARDLVQYMVRRGQMTQEEADKLIRQAEDAQVGRPKVAPPKPVPSAAPAAASAPASAADEDGESDSALEEKSNSAPAAKKAEPKSPSVEKDEDMSDEPEESEEEKPAAKKAAAKTPAAKKAPAKKK